MKLTLFFTLLLLSFAACKKDNTTTHYTGQVAYRIPGTSGHGGAYLIRYGTDSGMTITLPVKYQAEGKTIKFNLRGTVPADFDFIETTDKIYPKVIALQDVQ